MIETIAVIIARAGSRGLPKKNMRLLNGMPLVAWSIEHALGSQFADAVVLTSDGQDILAVGRRYGINVYERSKAEASDTATIDSAVRHGVESWEAHHGTTCRRVAILYANVVLRPPDLTDRAVHKLIQTGADSVQCLYPVGAVHPLWMRRLAGPQNDVVENYEPNEIYRRQDLPPVYMISSGVIAVTRSSLFDVDSDHPHAFLGRDRRAIVTAKRDVVDIDDESDLLVAEAMLAQRQSRPRKAS